MKIEYDNDIHALYIRLQEKFVARTLEIEEGLNIDFDEERYSLADIFNIAEEI
ncbi:MAG: DUF2283 domain-containing protein [Deltaproteobacteria bacterium]|nr:DUF2283 domain-containing protein [Deltaproteobacteria bacterium]